MNPLENLLRPAARALNRRIRETTPARELCRELDGTVAAVRVRDTGLAMYFDISAEEVVLTSDPPGEPDVAITGSVLTLSRLAATGDLGDIRVGAV